MKKVLGIFASDSIKVGSGGGFLGRPAVETAYCKECNKMIINL
ncbi:hypothetical protein [Clostridium sp.]